MPAALITVLPWALPTMLSWSQVACRQVARTTLHLHVANALPTPQENAKPCLPVLHTSKARRKHTPSQKQDKYRKRLGTQCYPSPPRAVECKLVANARWYSWDDKTDRRIRQRSP